MFLTMLKCKLHRATVTQADLNYEGSITIDKNLMEQTGLIANEQVDVLDITNGARITTYTIEGERGSGIISINGAAAHLINVGDLVIICAYASMSEEDAKNHNPRVLLLNEENQVIGNAK